MRRYMMRIAEHFAKETGCLGLITGESIGQVASQTMQSLAATNDVCTLPVYRPVIGFDKQEIVEIAEKINTFETSILPFVMLSRPPIRFNKVDFPEPLLPKTNTSPLSGNVKVISLIALCTCFFLDL